MKKNFSLHPRFAFIILILFLFGLAFPVPAGRAAPAAYDCAAQSQVPLAECSALVALYEQTGGENWSAHWNWLETVYPCGWHGVTCTDGRVTKLQLQNHNLNGPLPTELGALSALEELNLADNHLSGPIPPELGNLSQLINLYLGNNLSGPIPLELGNLANLEQFGLGDNPFGGSIPAWLGNLSNLTFLHLMNCNLDGPIPPELGNLTRLKRLVLGKNHLGGSIPAELAALPDLEGLYLEHNRLSGAIPSGLGSLPLRYLWLNHNQLSGEIPADLKRSHYMFSADFGYNRLTASDPELLAWLQSENPDWAATQTVTPADITFASASPAQLLVTWQPISYTADGGYYEIGLAPAAGGPYSFTLQTADKSAAGHTFDSLPYPTTYLRLRTFTPAHDDQQNDLWSDPSAPLALYNCLAQSEIPQAECQALSALFNGANGGEWSDRSGWMSGLTPCAWFGVTCVSGHVSGLALPGNALSGSLPAEIGALSGLQTLNLASNHLSGELPPEISVLSGLQTLDLSSNRLEGLLPVELAQLGSVTQADLGYNAFSAAPSPALDWLALADPDWAQTQTVLPARIQFGDLGGGDMQLTWTPIVYTQDGGFYEISLAEQPEGPFSVYGQTADKAAATYTLSGLTPGARYYVRLRTYTPPHGAQPNEVWSAFSPVLASFNCLAQSDLPAAECQALIDLFNNAGGLDSSLFNTYETNDWLETASPCAWRGVTCVGGHVQVLALGMQGLNGMLAGSLDDLMALQYLDLSGNGLQGSIPSELGSLPALQTLNLSSNRLSGPIPASLGGLAALRLLYLAGNELQGPLPASLGSLGMLEELNLYNNNIDGPIPPELGNLSQLQSLYMSLNQLSGSIPGALGNLANLTTLHLYMNRLSGPIPPELGQLRSLLELMLSSNALSGELPLELLNLSENSDFYSIGLNHNALYVRDPFLRAWLDHQVDYSYAEDWERTQTIAPIRLAASAASAGSLLLAWTPISYTQDGGYYEIGLANQPGGPFSVHGQTPDKAAASYLLDGLAPNTTYYIRLRTYTPAHPDQFNELWSEYTPVLAARNCLAQSQVPQAQCEALQGIYHESGGAGWTNRSGWLQDDAPCAWYGVTCTAGQVTGLALPRNHLSGALPAHLAALGSLQSLDLSGNHLSGPLPAGLENLTSLAQADLSYNLIETTAPAALAWLAQVDPDWAQTQTVAPSGVSAASLDGSSLLVTWQPIAYTQDSGIYEISIAAGPGGPYTVAGYTADKLASSLILYGLPYRTYAVRLRSYTAPHAAHPDELWSGTTGAYTAYNCHQQAMIPAGECQGLIALYNSTDGRNWNPRYSWLADDDPCNWEGVYCEDGSHVSEIGLDGHELKGTLPAELSQLKYLYMLNLSGNELSGPLLPALADLPALQYLSLDFNQFSGALPAGLPGLPALIHLGLGSNQFSGPIPPEIGGMTGLRHLNLFGNQLSGSIPSEIGGMAALEGLSLESNQLSGAIPPQIGSLANLQWLGLSENQLSGALPAELGNLTALTDLWLHNNQLSGALPAWLGNLAQLEWLSADGNQLSGPIPAEIGNLGRLEVLRLENNQLDGPLPPELGDLVALKSLGVEHNHLNGPIPSSLGKLGALSHLDMSANQLSGTIPTSLANIPTENLWANFSENALSAASSLHTWLAAADPDWETTQTVPPGALQVSRLDAATLQLTWQPILYTADGGYYEISYATAPLGPYTLYGQTTSKSASSYTLDGLVADTIYYLRLRTFTPAHGLQQNDVWSVYSPVLPSSGALLYRPLVSR